VISSLAAAGDNGSACHFSTCCLRSSSAPDPTANLPCMDGTESNPAHCTEGPHASRGHQDHDERLRGRDDMREANSKVVERLHPLPSPLFSVGYTGRGANRGPQFSLFRSLISPCSLPVPFCERRRSFAGESSLRSMSWCRFRKKFYGRKGEISLYFSLLAGRTVRT
jgi:hypothetical protein